MKNFYLFFFVLLLGCVSVANAQNISNEGSEFWLAFATHDPSGNLVAQMNVNVTSKENTEVTVSCGTYTQTKKIPANTVVVFAVPRANSYIDFASANGVLSDRGIHVVVTPNQPNVSVYSHVYANARSAASLILPVGALGQKYYSMNYEQDAAVTNGNPARNFLVLVAAEANTQLVIHTKNGTAIPVTLNNVGDVYEYIPSGADDLTGTYVEVDQNTGSKCKKFAAFSGSTSVTIACGGSRDPLFQQLYPVSSWGKNYGVVPFFNRNYILRVLAQEDNTTVNVGGTSIVLNKGVFYEAPIANQPIMVSADKLISVAQYSLTQACSSAANGNMLGDPEMVLLNPIEFNINKITLFSAAKNAIVNKYLNVFMKTNRTNTFRINGNLPSNGTWFPMPSDPTYSYIQIEVGIGLQTEESLTLTAADGFNAIAYGYGSAESYAYSAGTNLASSQYLVLLNKVTSEEVTEVCIGQEVEFNLTLPYLLTKINWEFDDGTTYNVNTPNYTTKVVNGQTLYTYKLDQTKTFVALNDIKLKVTGDLYGGAQQCNLSTFEFTFALHVSALPSAIIGGPTSACLQEKVDFKDQSITNMPNKLITKWKWDFDDPGSGALNVSDQQNPSHLFTTAGKHTIKLTVSSENGCMSDVKTFEIYINPKPLPSLKSNLSKTCPNTTIQFTDLSTVSEGSIIKWKWDFGDGTQTDTRQNPTHSYASTGVYKVILTVETAKGCIESSLPMDLEVTGPITSNFNAPDICVKDPLTTFENLSANID
ncbi:MAG: PKD domain-containing protein, partial [Pedobacter sp.]|nr:PKD domain-containing protein [Pedobacter sp.]